MSKWPTLNQGQHNPIFLARFARTLLLYTLLIQLYLYPSRTLTGPCPPQARSLLQGSPFPREGTEVPSPRWEVSSETPLPRERRAVQGPSLPGGEHVYSMLPLRDGGWELRLPSLYPQDPYPQSPFSTGQFTWLYTCAYSLSGGLYGIQHSRLLNA